MTQITEQPITPETELQRTLKLLLWWVRFWSILAVPLVILFAAKQIGDGAAAFATIYAIGALVSPLIMNIGKRR